MVVGTRTQSQKDLDMSLIYSLEASDQIEYDTLIQRLTKERRQRGWTADDAVSKIGKTDHFIHDLEKQKRDSPSLSRLELWASLYDMRIEPVIGNLHLMHVADPLYHQTFALSRPFEATSYLGMWLPSALQAWRVGAGISVHDVAAKLGITADAVAQWEKNAADPNIKRALVQARAMGTFLQLQLWHRDDWIFT